MVSVGYCQSGGDKTYSSYASIFDAVKRLGEAGRSISYLFEVVDKNRLFKTDGKTFGSYAY